MKGKIDEVYKKEKKKKGYLMIFDNCFEDQLFGESDFQRANGVTTKR